MAHSLSQESLAKLSASKEGCSNFPGRPISSKFLKGNPIFIEIMQYHKNDGNFHKKLR